MARLKHEHVPSVPTPDEDSERERERIRQSNDRDQELERQGLKPAHNRGYDEVADGIPAVPEPLDLDEE